jgi:heat shock protein HslJ
MRYSLLLLLTVVLLLTARVSAATSTSIRDNALAGTEWRFVSFGKAGAESAAAEDVNVTIKFGADGKVAGSGGCNSYGGQYSVRGDGLSLGRIISTRRACAARAAMEQEQRYFEALGSVKKFRLAGNQLTMFYDEERGTLNFVKTSPTDSSAEQEPYEVLSSPVEMLASYFNAVNRREYERAYGYWQTPSNTLAEFARGYAETVSVRLIVEPPTVIDGAAGSLYAEIPAVLIALQRDGSRRIFAGCYVTRKSNLRPPDAPKEDVWHIYKAKMRPAAGNASVAQLLAQPCRD